MALYDKYGLTKRERDVYNYIVTYKLINGISPTMSEIGEGIITSRSFVRRCLQNLEKKGVLEYDGSKRRTINIKKFLV